MDWTLMRLPIPNEENLSDAQRTLRDAVLGSRKGLGPEVWGRGPFGVWQSAPNVGQAALDLGAAVRFNTEIAADVREVAICTVGVHYKANFEFAAHKKIGIDAGLNAEALDRLAAGEDPQWTGELELVHRYTTALLKSNRVSSALHDELVSCFGEDGAVEIVTTIGYYCLICLTLNAFEVQVPDEMDDPWPNQVQAI
jgi:4-carboxymuconolactone decarboxylase